MGLVDFVILPSLKSLGDFLSDILIGDQEVDNPSRRNADNLVHDLAEFGVLNPQVKLFFQRHLFHFVIHDVSFQG